MDRLLEPVPGRLTQTSTNECDAYPSFAPAKAWVQRQSKKRGAKKAHAVLEARLGRAVSHLWRKQVAFDAKKFLAS